MRTVLSVSLPENISEELERFAKSTGRNMSDIVSDATITMRYRLVVDEIAIAGKYGNKQDTTSI